MALYLVIFAVCLVVIGGTLALLMTLRIPRYRTEPEHLLQIFDRALAEQATETEWHAVVGYPIRHDEYLEGVRRSAQRLMEEHGRPWKATQGGSLLSQSGREELILLRDHLTAHMVLQAGQRGF